MLYVTFYVSFHHLLTSCGSGLVVCASSFIVENNSLEFSFA